MNVVSIDFFSGKKRLLNLGLKFDPFDKEIERMETFEIADDEQLVGCQLDENTSGNFLGVTWLKMKVRF